MDPLTILLLCFLPVLLIGSAFFSGTETALFSLTRQQRRELASLGPGGRVAERLIADTRALLITLLMGNMTINVLYFVISSVALIRLGQNPAVSGLLVAALTLAPLLTIILLGEVLPKLIAARLPTLWSRVVAIPMLVVHQGILPIRHFAQLLVITPLARLLAPQQTDGELRTDELEALLRNSRREGIIDAGEQQLLGRVMSLGRLKVRDLMTPRVDLEAHDVQADPAELNHLAHRTRLKRLPIYDGDLDHILGVVHERQVLLLPPDTRDDVRALIRPVRFVPELQRADRLLIELRRTGETLVIVVDEYGGTAGLVTLEDLVEHLVGTIPGSYESEHGPPVRRSGPGRWTVDADLAVHDWGRLLDPTLPLAEAADEQGVTTAGGLLMALLGRLPEPGEGVRLGDWWLEATRVEGTRLVELLVRQAEPGEGEPPGSAPAEPTDAPGSPEPSP
jgi:CBS domain containing-hemolysin-like protein